MARRPAADLAARPDWVVVERCYEDDEPAAVDALVGLIRYSRSRDLAALYPTPERLAAPLRASEAHQRACSLTCRVGSLCPEGQILDAAVLRAIREPAHGSESR